MGRPRSYRRVAVLLLGALLYAAGSPFSISHAQVTADVSPQGNLGTVVTPGPNFDITGGTRPEVTPSAPGPNLFHGFDSFSVGAGEIANFINDTALTTTNILSRVTGGAFSDIAGTIQTSGFPGAALWLINPAGIVFGPGASLDVEGSFHATTADFIRLGTDGIFYAEPTQASVLTTSPPSAFGFLTADTAFIEVIGAALLVPEGETFSLVGGELSLVDSFLLAPAGDMNLVSVASPGEATFNSAINTDGFAGLGPVNIVDASVVDGKNVYIRGGQLVISDALVFPGGFSLFGFAPPPDGGEVNVKVSGDVIISGTELVPIFEDIPGIQTFAGSSVEILPAADVPDITIEAGGTVSVSGFSVVLTNRLGPGDPANVTVTADTVRVENGASISTVNTFAGPGNGVAAANTNAANAVAAVRDSLTVNANTVELDGAGAPGFTGLAAQGQFHPGYGNLDLETLPEPFHPDLTLADGGTITVNANTLIVRGGAEITTDSFAFGRSGDINLNVRDMFLSGPGAIAAQSILAGNSGNIKITAIGSGQIEISDGFRISASTGGSGDGGTVDITAGESISVSGANSQISSATVVPPDQILDQFAGLFGTDYAFLVELASEIFGIAEPNLFDVLRLLRDEFGVIDIEDLTVGDGGKISLTTPILTVSADAAVTSSTNWDGNAGAIEGNVGHLLVNSGAEIRSRSGLLARDTGELLVGRGNAGTINLTATGTATISVSGAGSSISTTTLGDGAGGSISLISAGKVELLNGGSVSADSLSTAPTAGDTGNITINAGTDILMSNGSVSTRAVTSDGGNIKLTAPNIVQLTGSQITTSVESGVGSGGNINLDPQFVVLNSSQITANAFGGPGGNINIVANNFIPSANSLIQASSALSTPGTIAIESPENNVAASIAQLPQEIVDVSGLLPEHCAARRAGTPSSSFTVAGRGGVPIDPDGYLPSFNAGTISPKDSADASPAESQTVLRDIKHIFLAMAGTGCTR